MVVTYFQSRQMDTLSTRRLRVQNSFRRILFSPRDLSYGHGYAKCVPIIRFTLNHCESILFRLGIDGAEEKETGATKSEYAIRACPAYVCALEVAKTQHAQLI